MRAILLNTYNETVEGFPECFMRLGAKRILPEDLSRLASAARLRNLLVHRYRMVSDEKVYESVKNGLKDFEEFVNRIRGLQAGRGEHG